MKRTLVAGLIVSLAGVALADGKSRQLKAAEAEAQMMAAMEKAAAPGPEHKQLAERIGTWTTLTRAWFAPGRPPIESPGTQEVTALLGGRFVQMHVSGNFMGKPFEGLGMEGYDNVKKQYVMTWADSMGTMITHAEGTGDAKERVFTGGETMPGGQTRGFRWIVKSESKDKYTMEMWADGPDGKSVKEMEVVYTRKL